MENLRPTIIWSILAVFLVKKGLVKQQQQLDNVGGRYSLPVAHCYSLFCSDKTRDIY